MSVTGNVKEFALTASPAGPGGMVAGPDGNLWFTEYDGSKIGRITTAGDIAEIPTSAPGVHMDSITVGPDGNIWFTEYDNQRVGRIIP
jgi:streptogramin lyase